MEVIKDTIKNVIHTLKISQKECAKDNPEVLIKKVFSKKELEHVKLNYFRKGILSLNISSSTWLYHLSLQKEDLLVKLRKESKAIKDIRFYLGETSEKEKVKTR